MCSGLSMTSFDLFEALETKLSCSALTPGVVAAAAPDDDTAPDPEDDPGDLPPDNDPIIYPTTPGGGPVGPGTHLLSA
jgi:hypothetical protein